MITYYREQNPKLRHAIANLADLLSTSIVDWRRINSADYPFIALDDEDRKISFEKGDIYANCMESATLPQFIEKLAALSPSISCALSDTLVAKKFADGSLSLQRSVGDVYVPLSKEETEALVTFLHS